MPRSYRRTRLSYRRRRYYKKKRSLYKKSRRVRKYQKGMRNTMTCAYILTEKDATQMIGKDNKYLKITGYTALFATEDFKHEALQWDQFHLDWISFTAKAYCPNFVNDVKGTMYSMSDRSGFPDNKDWDYADLQTYGSFKKSFSSASGMMTTTQFLIPTTMQEKSTWISTDISGVAGKGIVAYQPDLIPRYRSVYFPWNPSFCFGFFNVNSNDNNTYQLIINYTYKFGITWRGKRRNINIKDEDQAPLKAGGDKDDTLLNPPDKGIQIEKQLKYDTNGFPYNINIGNLFESDLNDQDIITNLIYKNLGTTLPEFGTMAYYIQNLTTDIAKTVYNSWVNRIVAICKDTLSSLLVAIASYGIKMISNYYSSSNDNSFLNLDSRTSFYLSETMAANGIPDLADTTAVTMTSYINTFNAGLHLNNFYKNAIKQIFIDNADTYNDVGSCSLLAALSTANIGELKYLINQTGVAGTLVQWTSLSITTSTGKITIPAYGVGIIQFPHANYWITGVIWNGQYTGSSSSSTVTNYVLDLYSLKDTICIDGEKLINTDTNNYVYYSIIAGTSTSEIIHLSLSNNSTLQQPINESIICNNVFPMKYLSGNGFLLKLGLPNTTEEINIVFPIYFSRNRLIA